VCAKSGDSFDCSKLPTGLGANQSSTSDSKFRVFVEQSHWNVTNTYAFKIQLTMKGGAVRYTSEKVLKVTCPKTVGVLRGYAPEKRDFYRLQPSMTRSYFYQWQDFRT
jgi:hypothetical protein